MSKTPFVATLIVSALLLGWVYASNDEDRPERKPETKVDRRTPADASPPARIYGFPDPRGIVLELNRRPADCCEATRFRIKSPQFVLWDDCTVVYRTTTYDYKRGKIPARKADAWLKTFRAPEFQRGEGGCEEFYSSAAGRDWTHLRGPGGRGVVSMELYGLAQFTGAHSDRCDLCRPLRPLSVLVEEISAYTSDQDPALTGLPVEVFLQFRSCGCRNHPDIVAVSKTWPLSGPTPSELCGRNWTTLTLVDSGEIASLAQALIRSAAVLDGEEIYTCFMRPILEIGKKDLGALASK